MLYSLPLVIEQVISQYLAANYTETPVYRAFRAGDLTFPCVTVKCAALTMDEPRTHVFSGPLEVTVFTQVDDTATLEDTHDARVSAIYDLLADESGLIEYANNSGKKIGVFQATINGLENGALETPRVWGTTITVLIRAQNKPIVTP